MQVFYVFFNKTKNLQIQVFFPVGLTPTIDVPADIKWLYLVEAGFYIHSIYATIFMDEWKKDSIAMLIHHVLADALIMFSLSFR